MPRDLPSLLLAGCAPAIPGAAPGGLPVGDCPADGIGVVEADLLSDDGSVPCEDLCDVTLVGNLTMQLPVTEAEAAALSCITAIEGTLNVVGEEGDPGGARIGLGALRRVEGNVLLGTSDTLEGLDGLGALAYISGDLSIIRTELVDIDGLDALVSLGSLGIFWNEHLEDVSGLSSLAEVQGTLTFSGNPCLPPEPAQALVDRLGDAAIGEVRLEIDGPCGGAR